MKNAIIAAVLVLSTVVATAQNGNRQSKTVVKKNHTIERSTQKGNNASATGRTRGAYKGSKTGQYNKQEHRRSGNMNMKVKKKTVRVETSEGLK